MSDSTEGRRPHDPNDPRGGGGPAGPPEEWDTNGYRQGELRRGQVFGKYNPATPVQQSHDVPDVQGIPESQEVQHTQEVPQSDEVQHTQEGEAGRGAQEGQEVR